MTTGYSIPGSTTWMGKTAAPKSARSPARIPKRRRPRTQVQTQVPAPKIA